MIEFTIYYLEKGMRVGDVTLHWLDVFNDFHETLQDAIEEVLFTYGVVDVYGVATEDFVIRVKKVRDFSEVQRLDTEGERVKEV